MLRSVPAVVFWILCSFAACDGGNGGAGGGGGGDVAEGAGDTGEDAAEGADTAAPEDVALGDSEDVVPVDSEDIAMEDSEDAAMEVSEDAAGVDPARTATSSGGIFVVSYMPTPDPIPVGEFFALELDIEGVGGEVVALTDIGVNARMPEHNHGMSVVPLISEQGDGTWHAEPLYFQMPGWWQLTVSIPTAGEPEVVTFDVQCGPLTCE